MHSLRGLERPGSGSGPARSDAIEVAGVPPEESWVLKGDIKEDVGHATDDEGRDAEGKAAQASANLKQA